MRPIIYLLFLFPLSCNLSKMEREMIIDGEYAKGNISDDSVFNGRIKFYDLTNHKLTSEADYRDGVLHGKQIIYYNNGKIHTDIDYRDGEQSGIALLYNEDGTLSSRQHYYYDFHVGGDTYYEKGQLKEYLFECLEGEELFYLHYDSIGSKPIDSIQEKFFFFNTQSYIEHAFNKKVDKREVMLYLLSPPKYRFDYTLLLIDKDYTIHDTLHTFRGINYEKVDLDMEKEKDGLFFAVGLHISDSINKKDMSFAKMIFEGRVKHEGE